MELSSAAGFGTDQSLLSNNELRRKRTMCDVTFKIGGDLFPCHRIMLITACTYFDNMFLHSFMAGETAIEMRDIEPGDFELLLDYIYCGSAKLNLEEDAHRLLRMSHYVGYKRPNDLFAYILVKLPSIPLKTVVSMYQFALIIDEMRFASGLAQHIARNFHSADEATKNGLLCLSESELLEVFHNPAFRMSSAETLEFLFRWMKVQLSTNEPSLERLLEFVQFSDVPQQTLARIFANSFWACNCNRGEVAESSGQGSESSPMPV